MIGIVQLILNSLGDLYASITGELVVRGPCGAGEDEEGDKGHNDFHVILKMIYSSHPA